MIVIKANGFAIKRDMNLALAPRAEALKVRSDYFAFETNFMSNVFLGSKTYFKKRAP